MSDWRIEAQNILSACYYVPLKILVWGPGDPGEDASPEKQGAFKKRLQIKDVLKEQFPRSEVHFSEDSEMIQITTGIEGQLRKEALQARTADMVLMLDISRGVDLELDYFLPRFPWFRDKVHVFLPQQYVSSKSLVKVILDYLRSDQFEGFTDEDFQTCTLATRKAVKATVGFALDKHLQPS